MVRRRIGETIRCTHFTWKVFKRGPIFYADGRSGTENLGKHSLQAKSEEEAHQNLQKLDTVMAQRRGLIPNASVVEHASHPHPAISIQDGWNKYLEHCEYGVMTGNRSPNTLTRYKQIRDRHVKYCVAHNIVTWTQFNQEATERYECWLVTENAATRSRSLAMTTILSVMKWMIKRQLLDAKCRVHIAIPKSSDTDTYCYTRWEMKRMLEFCHDSMTGQWLRPILIALATTGMRIGELSSLRWSDIDFEHGVICIRDERHSGRKEVKGRVRTTKGRRSRQVPLNNALTSVLRAQRRHPDGFVFHGPKGASIVVKRVLSAFKHAVRDQLIGEFPTSEGDVGFKHGTIHSFRHYFVSEAFRMNFTETDIMDWVGHRDSQMVHRYRHLRPGKTQQRMRTTDFLAADSVSSAT